MGIRAKPRIWKISINGTGPSHTKAYCLQKGEARIGWGKTGSLLDSSEPNDYYQSLGSGDKGTLDYFTSQMAVGDILLRSEEHTSELQSLMRISYAVFCLKKKTKTK